MKKGHIIGALALIAIAIGAVYENVHYDRHKEAERQDKRIRALRMVQVIESNQATATLLRLDGKIETVIQDHSPFYIGGVYEVTLKTSRSGQVHAMSKRLNYVTWEHKLCAIQPDYDPRISKPCQKKK